MILGKNEIVAAIKSGAWTCHRDGERIGVDDLTINPNSVNVTLGSKFLWPKIMEYSRFIDLHRCNTVEWSQSVARQGEVSLSISPGQFLLAHVREKFNCSAPLMINGQERYFAPMIEGRSTVARCGLSIHATAGFGDYGFDANFTLELTTALPIILRPGDEIAQIVFMEVSSPTHYNSVYSDQYDAPRAPVLGWDRFQRNGGRK